MLCNVSAIQFIFKCFSYLTYLHFSVADQFFFKDIIYFVEKKKSIYLQIAPGVKWDSFHTDLLRFPCLLGAAQCTHGFRVGYPHFAIDLQ